MRVTVGPRIEWQGAIYALGGRFMPDHQMIRKRRSSTTMVLHLEGGRRSLDKSARTRIPKKALTVLMPRVFIDLDDPPSSKLQSFILEPRPTFLRVQSSRL
jgi:hypothetical protein